MSELNFLLDLLFDYELPKEVTAVIRVRIKAITPDKPPANAIGTQGHSYGSKQGDATASEVTTLSPAAAQALAAREAAMAGAEGQSKQRSIYRKS